MVAVNSFFVFAQENRNDFKRLHPGLDNAQITSLLGQKWRSMSDSEKNIFKRKAAALKKVCFAVITLQYLTHCRNLKGRTQTTKESQKWKLPS